MNKALYAVYGASGFGREVMPLAVNYLKKNNKVADLLFIDDGLAGETVNGYQVYSYQQFVDAYASEKYISFAIANSAIREKLSNQAKNDGIQAWSLAHDNVVKLTHVKIEEGGILCPFVTLTSNIKIGKQFQANIYSYVGHDCRIGDYVTFAPSVKCNGNIVIEDHAYIGTGAIIKQGKPGRPLTIGKGAIVGMGAVVTKNVAPGETVIGNPAKSLSRESMRSR